MPRQQFDLLCHSLVHSAAPSANAEATVGHIDDRVTGGGWSRLPAEQSARIDSARERRGREQIVATPACEPRFVRAVQRRRRPWSSRPKRFEELVGSCRSFCQTGAIDPRQVLVDECGPASHEVEGIAHEGDPERVDCFRTEPLLLMPNHGQQFSIYQCGWL